MSKIAKLFRAAGMILRKPYLINKVLDDQEVWRKRVIMDHGLKDGLAEVGFHEISGGEKVLVRPFSFLEGGSLPTDLALLRILASGIDNCRYFEIGTWRGESVANVAEVAMECITLNLSPGQMREAGLSEEYIGQHAMFSKGLSNVTHLEGDSLYFDFAGLNKKFDIIFIDGDHHYASIRTDTQHVFKHLLHERSIVVWHDYAWQPGNIRFETMAAILDGVPEAQHGKLFAVRNTLCAIYHPGIGKGHEPSVVAKPGEAFEVLIGKI